MDHRYILAWFVFIFCRVDGESLYGLKGLSVSLKPALPDKPADILWKHNGNKAVEFGGYENYVYGTFKNRTTLDWHTADIEITDLRYEDGGNYELEATINNKLHRSSKTLVVIDTVPKPTISCKMNNDSSSKKSGTLECSADYKHSQTRSLLKFEWGSHGNVQPGPQLTISLGHEHDGHEYICNVSNPKSSETTTFTAKDCYPDESSSVPLAVGLAVLFLIIFVVLVLGIAYSCYRKRKACFAVKGDEESPPGSTKNVSDDHNTTAQVEEKEHLLPSSSSNQPPHTGLDGTTALGDGNSQNVNEAYQRDGKTNNGKAPPVRPRGALSPEAAKKEDPAVGLADSEEEKKSHQESSAAPEEPGSEQTTAQAEENSTPTDEAATDQQADRNKGYVDSVRRRFDPKFCEKS
ncbi:lymphocyte function-associated antigen 3 isoform X3 [Larimichthys crocea]|uniref:lymphocyte function-associated antigen 3 isoform X3 n=1 Tax=Larimichthys crocea TaxID=215358 RepID=UPI000F5D8AF6|nr:lymphocyte function-associated antigen 3 isoform X3 [Larimichthys crocea]